MRWIFLALVVALSASVAIPQATDTPLRELATADEARDWAAVGRLDLAGTGFCTGALITPSHVLTAAHCVFEAPSGRAIPPEKMVFRAGLRDGFALAERRARRVIVHPDYDFHDRDRMRRVATDIALVELMQPIRTAGIVPFERINRPRRGDRVMVVSYARDRERAPSLQERCHMLDAQADVLVYSCDINFGASGAPIFVLSDARPKIASVVSAMTEWRARDVALGASLGGPLDQLLNRLAATDPVFRSLAVPDTARPGERKSIAEQLGRSQGGGAWQGIGAD